MGQAENLTLLTLDKRPDFVETPYVQDITERALSYLRAGYPVHLSGPAGTGKRPWQCTWRPNWIAR